MEESKVSKLVESLLEEADIDIERDMWRWVDDDDIACNPSEEVKDGLACALLLFFSILSEQAQQEIAVSIHKFAYCPRLRDLLYWQGEVSV